MTTLTEQLTMLKEGKIDGFECYSIIMGRETVWYRVRRWAGNGFQLKQVSYQMGPEQEGSGIYGNHDDHTSIYEMHDGALHGKRYLQKMGKKLERRGDRHGYLSDAFEKVKDADVALFRSIPGAQPQFDKLEVSDASDIIDETMRFAEQRAKDEQERMRLEARERVRKRYGYNI